MSNGSPSVAPQPRGNVRRPRSEEHVAYIAWLGRRVKTAREKAGYSQYELAERVGKSQNWVHDVERGAVSPAAFDLQRIAKATDYPVAWFIDPDFSLTFRRPATRYEWEQLFGDEDRARAHYEVDRAFSRTEG